MKDLLENENGMLDQGYFSPEQIEMRNIASGLTERPPMVPTSPLEDRLMRRTMNEVTPQQQMGAPSPEAGASPPGEAGPRSYESPWQALRNQRQNALAERMQYQQGELSKKLNNPFFKVTDFVADVARNTIGLPMNMVTGGTGFTYDPSNDARTTTRSRLENLEDLQFANNELYQTGVESRATAMEDMTNKQRTAEINAMNAQTAARKYNNYDTGKFTPESLQAHMDHFKLTGEDRPDLLEPMQSLEYSRNPDTNVVEVYSRNGFGGRELIGPADQVTRDIDLKNRQEAAGQWETAANTWANERDFAIKLAATSEVREKTVAAQIKTIRRLAEGAAGFGGLLANLPGSKFKELQQALLTLKGLIGFKELRALKDSGATLGQVAVIELQQLNAIQGSLDQSLSSEALLETLNGIEEYAGIVEQSITNHVADQTALYGTRTRRARNPYGSKEKTGQPENSAVTTDSINTTGTATGAKEVIKFENGSTIQY